jgi:serine/threonine protein kinase
MSPEQCHGDKTGPPTDVYAAGALLYEALTGRLPFDASSPAAFMAAHLFVEIPPMRSRSMSRTIPAPMEALVRRTLSKTAEERPTASEFRKELADVIRGNDALSAAERASRERSQGGVQKREDRALGGGKASSEDNEQQLHVLLCGHTEIRATQLRQVLAVSAIVATDEESSIPPNVILMHASYTNPTTVRDATLKYGGAPVLVVDVDANGADATAAVIRSGASDMVAFGTDDSELARRVRRLARRKR